MNGPNRDWCKANATRGVATSRQLIPEMRDRQDGGNNHPTTMSHDLRAATLMYRGMRSRHDRRSVDARSNRVARARTPRRPFECDAGDNVVALSCRSFKAV
jgi:hypothetical protein